MGNACSAHSGQSADYTTPIQPDDRSVTRLHKFPDGESPGPETDPSVCSSTSMSPTSAAGRSTPPRAEGKAPTQKKVEDDGEDMSELLEQARRQLALAEAKKELAEMERQRAEADASAAAATRAKNAATAAAAAAAAAVAPARAAAPASTATRRASGGAGGSVGTRRVIGVRVTAVAQQTARPRSNNTVPDTTTLGGGRGGTAAAGDRNSRASASTRTSSGSGGAGGGGDASAESRPFLLTNVRSIDALIRSRAVAMATAEAVGDKHMEAEAAKDLGEVYLAAAAKLKEAEDATGMGALVRALAETVSPQRCFSEAVRYLKRSVELREAAHAPAVDVVPRLTNLALAEVHAGDSAAGIATASKALKVAEDAGSPQLIGKVSATLAKVHYEAGNHSKAVDILKSALEKTHAAGASKEELAIVRSLAGALSNQGKFTEAKEMYMRGLLLCRKIGDPAAELSLLGPLEQVCRALSDFSSAADCVKQARSLRTLVALGNALGAAVRAAGQDGSSGSTLPGQPS